MSYQQVALDWMIEREIVAPDSWITILLREEESIHTSFITNMILQNHGDHSNTIKAMCSGELYNQIPGIEELKKTLPCDLLNLMLTRDDIWIAGGSLARSVFNSYNGEDIDIFCLTEEAHQLCQKAINGRLPSGIEPEISMLSPYLEDDNEANRVYEGMEEGPSRLRIVYNCSGILNMAGCNQKEISELEYRRDTLNARRDELHLAIIGGKDIARHREESTQLANQYLIIQKILDNYLKCQRGVHYRIDLVDRSKLFAGQPACPTIDKLLETFDMNMSQVTTNLQEIVVTKDFTKGLIEGQVRITNHNTFQYERYRKYLKFLPGEFSNPDIQQPIIELKRSPKSYG